MKAYKYNCLVLINGIPTPMSFEAFSFIQAKNYFESFGKLLNEPRIVE